MRLAVAAILFALTTSSFFTWRMGGQIKNVMAAQIEVLTGTERLQHFGNVLELSIRSVIATGDEQAAIRYRSTQPQLRATMNSLRNEMGLKENENALAKVDDADAALVAMERQALELAQVGQLTEARAIINSPRYSKLLTVYVEGLEAIELRAQAFATATEKKLDRYIAATLVLSLATFGLVAFAWLVLFRPARRWGYQINEARRAAEDAHRRLADSQVRLQLANDQLFKQARTDHLTKLHTRLKFHEDVGYLWPRVERYQECYCALICDIDNFKQYNDVYGHIEGDRVLKAVADALKAQANGGDQAYRFGGEEFVIILPNSSIEEGAASAERYRNAVEKLGIPHKGSSSGVVTISIGVGVLEPGHAWTVEDWIDEADAALYDAKRAGRNRVEGGIRFRLNI